MDLGLSDKNALVTGSYRGTGAGIARILAAEGAHVFVHGFEPGQGDDLVAEIADNGGEATVVTGGLDNDDEVQDLLGKMRDLDVLVNNYGTPNRSSWTSTDHWAKEWDINVLTAVRVAQAVAPNMRNQQWGRIIFLGTVGSRRPGETNPGYYGAKAGLHAVVRSMAQSLRGSGVTVNLISPGMIGTSEVKESIIRRAARTGNGETWDEAEAWALKEVMPNLNERVAGPEDIAQIVAFVAGEPAWHINGADLAIDGGTLDAR